MQNAGVAIMAFILVLIVVFFGACVVFETDETPATTTTTSTTTTSTTTSTTTTTTTFDPATLETLPPVEDLGSPTLTDSSSLSTVGLDQVLFGQTANQAQRAAGTRFTPITPINGVCYQATPDNGPEGITFWITGGTVERIDIDTPGLTTRSGAGLGNTEVRINEMFGERIVTTPLPDGSGNLLAYVPQDESDKEFRVMFVSDGDTIVRLWSGRLPWAEVLSAGCPAVSG